MKSNDLALKQRSTDLILWILCLILFIAYVLPWLSSQSTALSLGAFDLSEWASLHPAVTNTTPAMMTPLLLRAIPLLIIFIITINLHHSTRNKMWWLAALWTLCLSLAMFPPLEFIISERSNTNYQQMFVLSAGIIIAGGIGLSGIFFHIRHYLTILTASLGIIFSLMGLTQTYQLYADFFLPRQIGIGGILTIAVFALIICKTVLELRSNQK